MFYISWILIASVIVTGVFGGQNDERWHNLPDSKYNVFVGQNKTFSWKFYQQTATDQMITVTLIYAKPGLTYESIVTSQNVNLNSQTVTELDVIYRDFNGRVHVTYQKELVQCLFNEFRAGDNGELFIQIDLPSGALTASTHITVYSAPSWIEDVTDEEIGVPKHKKLTWERHIKQDTSTPKPSLVSVKFFPSSGRIKRSISEEYTIPNTITFLPTVTDTEEDYEVHYSNPEMMNFVHLITDRQLSTIGVMVHDMDANKEGEYQVALEFSVADTCLNASFRAYINESENTITGSTSGLTTPQSTVGSWEVHTTDKSVTDSDIIPNNKVNSVLLGFVITETILIIICVLIFCIFFRNKINKCLANCFYGTEENHSTSKAFDNKSSVENRDYRAVETLLRGDKHEVKLNGIPVGNNFNV